jgi:hypothetical protein
MSKKPLYTSEIPKRPGYYWFKSDETALPEIVELSRSKVYENTWIMGRVGKAEGILISLFHSNNELFGPRIEAPVEPGSLRVSRAEIKKVPQAEGVTFEYKVEK